MQELAPEQISGGAPQAAAVTKPKSKGKSTDKAAASQSMQLAVLPELPALTAAERAEQVCQHSAHTTLCTCNPHGQRVNLLFAQLKYEVTVLTKTSVLAPES